MVLLLAYYLLLQMKDVMVEKFVQLLVGEIDAHLLKGVNLLVSKRTKTLKQTS